MTFCGFFTSLLIKAMFDECQACGTAGTPFLDPPACLVFCDRVPYSFFSFGAMTPRCATRDPLFIRYCRPVSRLKRQLCMLRPLIPYRLPRLLVECGRILFLFPLFGGTFCFFRSLALDFHTLRFYCHPPPLASLN